jgi:hypothetical protein
MNEEEKKDKDKPTKWWGGEAEQSRNWVMQYDILGAEPK